MSQICQHSYVLSKKSFGLRFLKLNKRLEKLKHLFEIQTLLCSSTIRNYNYRVLQKLDFTLDGSKVKTTSNFT